MLHHFRGILLNNEMRLATKILIMAAAICVSDAVARSEPNYLSSNELAATADEKKLFIACVTAKRVLEFDIHKSHAGVSPSK